MGVPSSHRELQQLIEQARWPLWRAFLGARGADGADDALGEAFAWASANSNTLLQMENPRGYLYRVGISRTTPRRQPILLPPEPGSMPEVEPELIPGLLNLTELQRSCVWLVHACDWTYAEVAEALGIGRSTVGTHVSRALTALRAHLEVSADA